jgi:hypothetical protein
MRIWEFFWSDIVPAMIIVLLVLPFAVAFTAVLLLISKYIICPLTGITYE